MGKNNSYNRWDCGRTRRKSRSERVLVTSELTYNLVGTIRHLGLPVAGVTVQLFDDSRPSTILDGSLAEQRTGARGEFSFAVHSGCYRLLIRPDNSTRLLRQSIGGIKVAGNTTYNISLSTGCIVSGSVHAASGAIIKDADVIAVAAEVGGYCQRSEIDQSGQFNLVLAKGKYYLQPCWTHRPWQPEDRPDEMPFLTPFCEAVEVDADRCCTIVLPELLPFTGVVVDGAGKPVDRAIVTIAPGLPDDHPLRHRAQSRLDRITDSSGRFPVRVQPGPYDLLIQPPRDLGLSELSLKSHELGYEATETFRLGEGVVLDGKVSFKGAICPWASVVLGNRESKASYSGRTSDRGEFTVCLPVGSYELTVQADKDEIQRSSGEAPAPFWQVLNVVAATNVDIELAAGYAVSGLVRDHKGQPRTGVIVAVCPNRGSAPDAADQDSPLLQAETGDAGRFNLSLAAGNYWLFVASDLASAQSIAVRDQGLIVDFVWQGGFHVKFEVVGFDEKPLSNCKVVWNPYGKTEFDPLDKRSSARAIAVTGSGLSGDDGCFELLLPSGLYSFQFEPVPHSRYQSKHIRQLSIAGDTTRRVTLQSRQEIDDGQLTLDFTPADGHE